MRFLYAGLVFGCFVGCDAPPPEFQNVTPTSVRIGKSQFEVRVNGKRALALRMNSENAFGKNGITERGIAAIESVSGCEVVGPSVRSDQVFISADIEC